MPNFTQFINETSTDSNNAVPVNNLEIYTTPLKVLLVVINLIFNSLIIIIIFFILKTKTFSNILFASNAICDFMVGLISTPFMIVFTYYGYWPLGKETCVFWVINDYSTGTISIYSYLSIALHRYFQIISPYKANENMNRSRLLKILAIWAFWYSYWLISVILITSKDFVPEYCYFTHTFPYVLATVLIGFILPIVAVFFINLLVLYELRKNLKTKKRKGLTTATTTQTKTTEVKAGAEEQSHSDTATATNIGTGATNENGNISNKLVSKKSKDFFKKETKAFICLCMVTGSLAILFSIFCVSWPIKAYCPGCVPDLLLEISYWNTYIYSAVNPILLFIFHDKFRMELKKLVLKLICCKK